VAASRLRFVTGYVPLPQRDPAFRIASPASAGSGCACRAAIDTAILAISATVTARARRGIGYLVQLGPSKEDMYFNYYATQVLNHDDGPEWERWNAKLRDYLIDTQSKSGHEHGSWYFPEEHALAGGRVYTTALCAMILEVYYRHLPLYGERTVKEGF
jgi:hypothetical protein